LFRNIVLSTAATASAKHFGAKVKNKTTPRKYEKHKNEHNTELQTK